MRTRFEWVLLLLLVPAAAHAQRPDTVPEPPPADSADPAVSDSLRLVKELEEAITGAAGGAAAAADAPSTAPVQGPINPRLLPDISAVGDLVGDFSPEQSTQPDESRLSVREVEVAIQAAVDPYFRGDIFLGVSPTEGIAIEQAFLTSTGLPYGLEARLGRFLLPFGKQNQTHRHDLHTFEYPYVIQRFLGEEGLKGTGASLSKLFAPFGFYQEIQLSAVDQLGEVEEDLFTEHPASRRLGGMGYLARLRNYWDLSQSTNVELGGSAMTGRRARETSTFDDFNAVNARQSTFGADLTVRWRPLQQGLYRSLILQGELMHQSNERDPATPAGVVLTRSTRDYTGAYVFGRWQLGRRLFIGGRYDWLQDPELDGSRLQAVSADLEFFPSEFSKFLVGYERRFTEADLPAADRILLQTTFSLGPHKPHPF